MIEETPPAFVELPAPAEGADGIEYLPLSFSREAALNAMGIHYGMVPQSAIRTESGLFRYNGDMGDTIKTLWICTIPNASEVPQPKTAQERMDALTQWTVQRAEKMPDAAYEAAQKWAQDKLGLRDDKGEPFWNAYVRFLRMMAEKDGAKFEVKMENEGGAPAHAEESDPNG